MLARALADARRSRTLLAEASWIASAGARLLGGSPCAAQQPAAAARAADVGLQWRQHTPAPAAPQQPAARQQQQQQAQQQAAPPQPQPQQQQREQQQQQRQQPPDQQTAQPPAAAAQRMERKPLAPPGYSRTFYKRQLPSPPAIEFASEQGALWSRGWVLRLRNGCCGGLCRCASLQGQHPCMAAARQCRVQGAHCRPSAAVWPATPPAQARRCLRRRWPREP